jgi:hypothetical protein
MNTITIASVKAILNNDETVFMKRGTGKKVHLSAGATRVNNLLCGVTYSRSGSRASYLRTYTAIEVPVQDLCKNCLEVVHLAVTPIV